MIDISGLVADPEFQAYPLAERLRVLQQVGADPGFIKEYAALDSSQQSISLQAPPPTEEGGLSKFLTMLTGFNESERAGGGVTPRETEILNDPKMNMLDKIRGLGKETLNRPQSLPAALMFDPVGALMRVIGVDPKGGNLAGGVDMLPAVGGSVGAAAGLAPGAALGSAGGEAIRQLIRRGVGLPASPGLVQQISGTDPNSPEAAATGMVGEALTGIGGQGISKLLGATRDFLKTSSLRNLINLLQPMKVQDKDAALALAQRMVDEGIAPFGTTRTAQVINAEKALQHALPQLAQEQSNLVSQGARVPTAEVVRKTAAQIPKALPTGEIPETGKSLRNASEAVYRDLEKAVGGASDVPIELAISEKQRLDKILQGFYNTGRELVPEAKQFTKVNADAWRQALHESYPDLGIKDARVSDLISITKLLRDAQAESIRVGGLGTAAQEGAAFGAAAAGRLSIPAMILAKAGISSGPWASGSAGFKRVFSRLAAKGANFTPQIWLRLAEQFGVPDEPEEDNLVNSLAGTVTPQKRVTKEDFIKKWSTSKKEDIIQRYQ